MKIVGVIPVRLGSSRFPGKGLVKVNGKEIVLHVVERASRYKHFQRLIVATDAEEIRELVQKHGCEVFFSSHPFRNGSERCAAAVADIDCDVCVNIQGDEICITPEIIGQVVAVLEKDHKLPVATAVFPISGELDINDRNLVKAALNQRDEAVKFSRIPIINNDGRQPPNYGHVGIYAFRKEFLMKYAAMPQTAGEFAESLEQLRILESGYSIGVARLDKPVISINAPDDLESAVRMLSMEGEGKS